MAAHPVQHTLHQAQPVRLRSLRHESERAQVLRRLVAAHVRAYLASVLRRVEARVGERCGQGVFTACVGGGRARSEEGFKVCFGEKFPGEEAASERVVIVEGNSICRSLREHSHLVDTSGL